MAAVNAADVVDAFDVFNAQPAQSAQLAHVIIFIFIFIFLGPLYYTTYNTAHAASRLWRYSSIYMNPF